MSDFAVLYFLQKKIVKNRLKSLHRHSLFKIVVVTGFSLLFWASLFALFQNGFRFLQKYAQDYFGFIVGHLFPLFFFSLFAMLIFSSTIIALSVFFKARETKYLVTCPLQLVHVFMYKQCETFIFATWAVFFLGLPVCFAYAIQTGTNPAFYPLLVITFIPFTAIPAIVGSTISLLLVLYIAKWRKALGISFLAVLMGMVIWIGYSIATYEKHKAAFTWEWLRGIMGYLDFARMPLLPSVWMSNAMRSLADSEFLDFGFQLFLLVITMLFLINLSYLLAQWGYGKAWSRAHTYNNAKSFWRLKGLSRIILLFPFLKPRDRNFLEKDIKIFLRDPLQWGQFGILLGLLLLYMLNLRTMRYDQQSIFWKHIIAILNLTATGLTISTFASRFIFPMLSLEGKRFWALGIMPLARSRILMAKFMFAVATLSITGGALILVSCYMLRMPWPVTVIHMTTILAISVGVAGISVGLGAIYPNFREDSPAKIVSGFGGTLNLVLTLVFVLLLVSIQVFPTHIVLKAKASYRYLFFPSLLSFLLTLVACIVPLYLGVQRFNRTEF